MTRWLPIKDGVRTWYRQKRGRMLAAISDQWSVTRRDLSVTSSTPGLWVSALLHLQNGSFELKIVKPRTKDHRRQRPRCYGTRALFRKHQVLERAHQAGRPAGCLKPGRDGLRLPRGGRKIKGIQNFLSDVFPTKFCLHMPRSRRKGVGSLHIPHWDVVSKNTWAYLSRFI